MLFISIIAILLVALVLPLIFQSTLTEDAPKQASANSYPSNEKRLDSPRAELHKTERKNQTKSRWN